VDIEGIKSPAHLDEHIVSWFSALRQSLVLGLDKGLTRPRS